MRIGCLQFAPQVGDVDNNLNRADAVLSKANPQDLDLLVLPELAFSGYNFKSLEQIEPFLEPTTSGITSLWARTTALRHNCVVTVGYPEKVLSSKCSTPPEHYNSAITVNSDGETIANYRKSFLYDTDETWALEGPDGFYGGSIEGLGDVAMGICMDLNPYKFEAPWHAWEFAYHILHRQANLVIISMAWLTHENPSVFSQRPQEPDMDTLSYWLSRLEPVIREETVGEIIFVLANRTGTEGNATYAGTSAVLGIQRGEVKVYGVLGRGERELLVVDTSKRPDAKLVSEPNSSSSSSRSSASSSKRPSKSAAEEKDSELSKYSELPPPLPIETIPEGTTPIEGILETHVAPGMWMGLGESYGTAGKQISVLSPVSNSPSTPSAPTELRSYEDLFAESLRSRLSPNGSPLTFSDEDVGQPESTESRVASSSPRESRSKKRARSDSEESQHKLDLSVNLCPDDGDLQYPELPLSCDSIRSQRESRSLDRSLNKTLESSAPRIARSSDFEAFRASRSRSESLRPRASQTSERSFIKKRSISLPQVNRLPEFEEPALKSPPSATPPSRPDVIMESCEIAENSPSSPCFHQVQHHKATAFSLPKFGNPTTGELESPSFQQLPDDDIGALAQPQLVDAIAQDFDLLASQDSTNSIAFTREEAAVLPKSEWFSRQPIFGSCVRPNSPGSRGANHRSRRPVVLESPLASFDGTAKAQTHKFETTLQMPPRSASLLQENYQTSITKASFGPRSEHTLRSSMW